MKACVRFLLALVLLLPLRAFAEESTIDAAEHAERSGEPEKAVALYRAFLAQQPQATLARRAEARLHWLDEHSEGHFQPLTALLRMEASDLRRDQLLAFEREIDAFPAGPVRREARGFVAGALARLGETQAALDAYRTWLAEPDLDSADHRIAATGAASMETQLGHLSAGIDLLSQAGLGDRSEALQLRSLRIIHYGHPIAIAVLVLFALGALVAAFGVVRARRWRELFSWRRAAVATYALAFPLLVGARYDDILSTRFQWLLLGQGAVLLLATVAGVGLRALQARRAWVVSLAANAALACVAVGFLTAERTELFVTMLKWYGL